MSFFHIAARDYEPVPGKLGFEIDYPSPGATEQRQEGQIRRSEHTNSERRIAEAFPSSSCGAPEILGRIWQLAQDVGTRARPLARFPEGSGKFLSSS